MDSKQSSLISPNIFALKLFGLWLAPNATSRLYRIYTRALICSITVFVAAQYAYLFENLNKLQEIVSTSYILLTHTIVLVKVAVVCKNRRKIQRLIRLIDSEIFAPLNRRQIEMIEGNKRLYTKIHSLCTYLGFFTCVFWTLRPMLVDEKILPMKMRFLTLDVLEGPWYEILFVFQALMYTTDTMVCLNIDTLTAGFMMVLGGQIDVLCDKLKHLDSFGFESDFEGFKNCFRQYSAILDFSRQIQEIYAVPILAQFVGAVVVLCTTMLQITIVPVVSIDFLVFAIYTACILTELCLYCWFGNEIIYKSNKIVHSIFHAPWLGYSSTLKKDLVFFMLIAKKPIVLRTAGIIPIGIQAFITVIRSSYSYFTVLGQFDA